MPERKRLPADRKGVTRTFRLAYQHKDGRDDVMKFYFTTGHYDDGSLGEVFIKADKPGSLASGSLDMIGILLSMLLQYGVSLEDLISKLKGTRFPPEGFTKDPELPLCTSPLDLLARFLEKKYLPVKE